MNLNASGIVIGLARLVADALEKGPADVQIAKDAINLFLDSGLGADLLSGYLTDEARARANAAVDIMEEAKLRTEGQE